MSVLVWVSWVELESAVSGAELLLPGTPPGSVDVSESSDWEAVDPVVEFELLVPGAVDAVVDVLTVPVELVLPVELA